MLRRITTTALLGLALGSGMAFAQAQADSLVCYEWQRFPMDAHRTGVTAPMRDNVTQASTSGSENP